MKNYTVPIASDGHGSPNEEHQRIFKKKRGTRKHPRKSGKRA